VETNQADSPSSPLNADELLAELAREGAIELNERGFYGKELAPNTLRQKAIVLNQVMEGRQPKSGGSYNLKALRYSHKDCIDRLVASPGISVKDLAQIYGVTTTWMGIVMNCDAFKVALAARREELIDPVLRATIEEHYGALAQKSVMVLMEKLDKPIDQISDKLALEAAALGARGYGLGEKGNGGGGGGSAVDHLAHLAHRLLDLNRPQGQVVETTSRVIEGD
jgi:hypothetical protein